MREPVTSDSVSRRRGRPKVMPELEQRSRIVSAAFKLFLKYDYGKTTMSAVAAHCGISKRTIYEIFPSKTDLLGAVIEAHRTTMLALPGDYDGLDLGEALERIFLIDIDPEADAERTAFLRLTLKEAPQHPELFEMTIKLGGERAHALLSAWMEERKRRGELDIDDTSSAAHILMDMIFGAVVKKSGRDVEWPGLDSRRAYMRRCIHIFVHGTSRAS